MAHPKPVRQEPAEIETHDLAPAEEELIDSYAKRLNRLEHMPARAQYYRCRVLAKAREEIKNSWAFKRLLEKVGMSEGEADKRLAVARSARISSEEFQLKIMPRVTGYSNLAALESLTDVAYQRLLSDLGSDTKITKSMIDSVSQGNTPGDKLLSGVVLKFSRQSLSQLTPAQQVENRSIIAAIQELAGKPGCIFKLTVRKNLLTLLGDKSERKQS